jgi:hypothetical protein
MPSNSTWVTLARKDAPCAALACEEHIVHGTKVVRGRIQRLLVSWHPECWLNDALSRLTSNGHRGPGRPALDLSPEDKTRRRKILARHSAYGQRLMGYRYRLDAMEAESQPLDQRLQIRVLRLELMQDRLWWDLQDLGGAPDGWRIPEGGREHLVRQREAQVLREEVEDSRQSESSGPTLRLSETSREDYWDEKEDNQSWDKEIDTSDSARSLNGAHGANGQAQSAAHAARAGHESKA